MVSIRRRARSFLTTRRSSPIFVLVLGLGLALAVPASASAATNSYSGVWNGNVTPLTHVANVTVEGLPDHTLVGTIGNFQTNDPAYSCLNGETINVFTAPSEFPNEYVVHNGLQGSQCTYGTWTFSSYSYSGSWHGSLTPLTHVPNVTVEGLPDHTLVGTIGNFQTNDPAYSCLNGETINVFTAPSEFPNEYVVHNGLQGSQCTYGTWTFPFYTVTLAAWIPQHTLNGAPLLFWADYALIGLSCWTPPAYEAPFVDEVITGSGDGHSGYTGTDRANVSGRITWNGSSITSFTPLPSYVATSHATAYYYIPPDPFQIHSCSIAKAGSQLSPTPSKTGSNSLSMEVKAQNNVAPPPLNPALDGVITVTVSGSAAHPSFSFSGTTELFPSYGVSVNGPWGLRTDTLFNAAGYGDPVSYELVATLLSCHTYDDCASVSGGIAF